MKSFTLPIILCSLALFGLLEIFFPFYKYKQNYVNRIFANFAIGILNAGINALVVTLLFQWVAQHKTWPGLFHFIPFPGAVALLSILLLDVYRYSWHVLMHLWPPGWRFHRVHHTERSMNISTAYRFHAIEVVASYIPMLFLIWLFGIDPKIVFIYDALFVVVEVFQHSNLALPLKLDRLLSYLIITPNVHRMHHSQIVKETNSNYGSLLTIWDRLFGTYRYSRAPKTIKIGLIEEPRPLSLLELLALPF